MTRFDKKCYLHACDLYGFLLDSSYQGGEKEWKEHILPFFGDEDGLPLLLTDNTLYDIATNVDKYFPCYSHYRINSNLSDEQRILNIMGWIVQECCTFRFTFS